MAIKPIKSKKQDSIVPSPPSEQKSKAVILTVFPEEKKVPAPVVRPVTSSKPESSEKIPPAQISDRETSELLGLPLKQPSEDERRLTLFKRFLDEQWGRPAVTVLFRGLFAGGYPPIPLITRWQIPMGVDVENLVWEQVQTDAFIEEAWPSIMMMLGDDTLNYEWAARILTVLAFFNIIHILPIVIRKES